MKNKIVRGDYCETVEDRARALCEAQGFDPDEELEVVIELVMSPSGKIMDYDSVPVTRWNQFVPEAMEDER